METYQYTRFRELLYDALSSEDVERWLKSVGFKDWHSTHRRLLRITNTYHVRPAMAQLLPYLMLMVEQAGNPDAVIVYLERFLNRSADAQSTIQTLASNPRAIDILVRLFAGSQYLTEILLHTPEYFTQLVELPHLAVDKGTKQLSAEIEALTASAAPDQLDEVIKQLRLYQRQELLRIGVCDLLELFDLPAVTSQLSNLADSLVSASLDVASRYTQCSTQGFTVFAMGKLGGGELNYSSDIDLLFVAKAYAGRTRLLGEKLIDILTRMTGEGFLYRVDMRLRPWGSSGSLVTSIRGYLKYLNSHARLWEKQALLKARVIAGDRLNGEQLLNAVIPLLFENDAQTIRTAVYRMKSQTERVLHQRGQSWGEVKLGEGSIRDIEFVIQYLQMAYGNTHPDIRSGNSLNALDSLRDKDLLLPYEYRILKEGYIFLRTVEHYLQMMHYRQTHSLPADDEALRHLARRLGFEGKQSAAQFLNRYTQHREAIRSLYLHHLRGDTMEIPGTQQTTQEDNAEHITRMDASYTTVFSKDEIIRHTSMARQLDHENLAEVHVIPREGGKWIVTIVAYDYPGELSLICGLLFVYGFSIEQGHVYTYESMAEDEDTSGEAFRKKIVDTFTVSSVRGQVDREEWLHYSSELQSLLNLMDSGRQNQARGDLAKRVGAAMQTLPEITTALFPIDIDIDNTSADHYTTLRISSPDTIGFLYEFTNALALNHIYISRVHVQSEGDRVQDVLYVTDAYGQKITSAVKLRELRAATVMIKHFTHLLPYTPNPEAAMVHFSEFISQLFRQPNWPDEIASLENPEVLNGLARLLGLSEFLWDDFLRMQHTNLFPVVRDVDALETMKSKNQLQSELETTLTHVHNGPQALTQVNWRKAINAFKDREMFRIDMRHILGHTKEFDEFSEELTALAEVITNATYHLCHEDLRAIHGTPLLDNGQVSEMSVCALGKFGGSELGFASDIELLFIYSGNGQTSGPNVITTAEFYEKVVQSFVSAIEAKREGIFEIDLRLRPYGRSGSIAVSLEGFRRYFNPSGPAWAFERQALVKLRPTAGNELLGSEIMRLRDAFIYTSAPFDVTAMRAMRERQLRHLVAGGIFNAKYSPGGLVDIEYLVQALQITHGYCYPEVRQTNIRDAMHALAVAGILSEKNYTQLRKAHTFLRWLIDGLRMVRGNAKDLAVPILNEEAFTFLAQRMRYGKDIDKLRDDLTLYTSAVQTLNTDILDR